jgi:hypothetical protein
MPKNGCGIFGNGNIIILDFKKGRDFFFSILKIRVDFGSEIIFDVRNKKCFFPRGCYDHICTLYVVIIAY